MSEEQLATSGGETDTALLTTTIGANLAGTVVRFGDRLALVDVAAGRSWTYNEFHLAVRQLAAGPARAWPARR